LSAHGRLRLNVGALSGAGALSARLRAKPARCVNGRLSLLPES
jgi:hypothetical protein